jgi:antiphage defense system Thoeris ThsB-like protein
MSYGIFGGGPGAQQPVKHKVFISYHHGGDPAYYDAFSRTFHDTYDVIYDNSLERQVDSDNVDYVMRRIRENYIVGSSCTIVLVGKETWGRKYVDWEIEATLDAKHGLIGVYLPTALRDPATNNIIVPGRLHDNIQSGFAQWQSWQEITASAAKLQQYVSTAKSQGSKLIVNTRERRLRNA